MVINIKDLIPTLEEIFEKKHYNSREKQICKKIFQKLIFWSRKKDEIKNLRILNELHDHVIEQSIIDEFITELEKTGIIKVIPDIKDKENITILHLSDIQIGKDTDDLSLGNFFEVLVNIDKDKLKNIDLIIFTGDLVSTGSRDEYKKFKIFVSKLNQIFPQITKDKIFFVPGNHDINWKLSENDESTKLDNYFEFIKEFYYDSNLDANFISEFEYKSQIIPIFCINSCVEINHLPDSSRFINIDKDQIIKIQEFFTNSKLHDLELYPLNMYCLHHPPNNVQTWNGMIIPRIKNQKGLHLFFYGDIHTENLPSVLYAKKGTVIISIGVGSPTVLPKLRDFPGYFSFTQFNLINLELKLHESPKDFEIKIEHYFCESSLDPENRLVEYFFKGTINDQINISIRS